MDRNLFRKFFAGFYTTILDIEPKIQQGTPFGVPFSLLSKNVRVRPGIYKGKREDVVFDEVHKQPIGFYVAFSETFIIAGQNVIVIPVVELFALTQSVDCLIKEREVQPSLLHQLVPFLVGCGELYLIHQLSRAALSSSMLVYPLTSGSRDMRFASAIALKVSSL